MRRPPPRSTRSDTLLPYTTLFRSPATDTREPSLVSSAAVFANATVAVSKGGVSKAPRGPFHTSVLQVLRTSDNASTAAGPTSRIISSAATSCTLTVRVGGLGANRSEEHTSELQSLMRISYAVFCLKKKTGIILTRSTEPTTN